MTEARTQKLAFLDRLLAEEYGSPEYRDDDPLDALIGTILSQNTSDVNSGRAYEAMRAAYPTWEAVMNAPRTALEAVLRPGGLARTKSARIQQLLRSIAARGPLDLDELRSLPTDEAERRLLAFDGVGPKTARCVLLFALGRDVFPVDTHILRILKRLGIVAEESAAEQAHALLPGLIPAGACMRLHLNLIAHGREVCHARQPECGRCVLKGRCRYFRSGRQQGGFE